MLPYFRRRRAAAVFHHPLDPAPRTAILAGGFESNRTTRVFPEGWSDAAQRFKPSAIAAPLQYLIELAAKAETIPLEHAVIAFTNDESGHLADPDRDLLWDAFGVPVFEQYLNAQNELLASECEAHAGLHVLTGCKSQPGDRSPCPCGSTTPRILPADVSVTQLELALAG
jgi:hypothetical protein